MQKLVFTNGGGNTIDLTSVTNGGYFGITNWEGLSGVGLNIQTQTVPFQDGAVFLDALMNQREITVTVAIQDNNVLEDRYERKRELISALNPKLGEGVLVYTNDYLSRQIKAVPQLPIFENKNSNDSGTLKASVTFSCCSPYWEDLEETEITIQGSSNVSNNGDVPCQIKAKINNNVVNPILYNNANKKEISLNGTFEYDVNIDTNIGNKKVETEKTGFKWVGGGTLNACCYGNGKVVYVGDVGVVEDCLSSEFNSLYISENPYTLRDITYSEDKGIFVAVGENKKIFTSSNGTEWVERTISAGSEIYRKVIYIDGKFYICGGSSLLASTDGISWEILTTAYGFNGLAYSEDLNSFVAIGGNQGQILTSSDCINWTQQTSGVNQYFRDIVYAGNIFVVVGNGGTILTSTDGVNWTQQTSGINVSMNSIEYFKNIFVVVGNDGTILTSIDSMNWQSQSVDIQNTLNGLAYAKGFGLFFACGNSGVILKSSNATDWSVQKKNLAGSGSGSLQGIAYSEELGLYVAVGNQETILTSTDGINWTIKNYVETARNLQDIVYANNMFIAVGTEGLVLTSTDGINWTERTASTTINRHDLRSIAYGNDIFVAVAEEGFTQTSTDGINWTYRHPVTSTIDIYGICYSEYLELFIAVGYQGVNLPAFIITSPDGVNWTQRTEGVNNTGLYGVISINNICIAVGSGGTILTSTDGINWIKRTSGTTTSLYAVNFNNNIFIIVGSVILTSTNGIDWVRQQKESGNSLHNVIYSDKFVLVGEKSIILNSYIIQKENVISQLTPQSDMTFNLETGVNGISFLSENDATCTLKFRQKYIGV